MTGQTKPRHLLLTKSAYLPLMRYALALCLLSSSAAAWDFSPSPICTLSHTTPDAEIVITYDADLPEYTLIITLNDDVWPDATIFAMRFDGVRPNAISTYRHAIDGPRLVVKDTGFGNVLDGLQFNATATSTADEKTVTADLTEAANAVIAFRACPAEATS